ncbi:MAG TPA: tripartite tricarboxylate transporter substrate-binding protein, partial [Rhizomicrobium sp.]|nr:tripartite tricarboxylate transporter substrate-binding protein [Rhizomicrobium sp.]
AVPDVPTMAEQGYKDLTFTGWFGLLAPAGVSPAIVNRLNAEVQEIVTWTWRGSLRPGREDGPHLVRRHQRGNGTWRAGFLAAA